MWNYDEAFSRNRGLISEEQQERFRSTRIAIVGMGGVGGVHLVTLARLGIGAFNIADPDAFEVANFNRQYGAKVSTVGHAKADVMAGVAKDINPNIKLNVWDDAITEENAEEFLQDVDIFVDGIDFFAIPMRRRLFQIARSNGIWAVTAGPIGFGTAWFCFDPNGMSFDEYFDMNDSMDMVQLVAAMLAGLLPDPAHTDYMDLSTLDIGSGAAPSSSVGCQFASGIIGAQIARLLLRPDEIKAAPVYQQFDGFHCQFNEGVLHDGNRSADQKQKREGFETFLKSHLVK